jgi:hypothetical protein
MMTSPLYNASMHGRIEYMRELILANANVNKVGESPYEWSCLMIAVSCGKLNAVRLLIASNADIHYKTNNGTTALSLASSRNHPDSLEILKILLAEGANPNE